MTPMSDLIDKWEETQRQTGRTTDLIDSLPNEHCTVVVHNTNMKKHFLDMVRKLRPELKLSNIKVIHIHTFNDTEQYKFKPVYFDNAALYIMNRNLVEEFK